MCTIYLLHNLSRTLYQWKIPLLPRTIYYFMRVAFTISIPWTARVGRGTRFNHWGMGIVVHRRAVIGENCAIGHFVTLGGTSGHHEVPVIGNHVHIGAGARILGPVKVGDHAVIAANAVVLHDIPPYAVVGGVPARIIKNKAAEESIASLAKVG